MPDSRLDSKADWRKAAEAPAYELELALWDLGIDPGDCLVCNKPFGSIASHIAGEKHYKCLGHLVDWKWPAKASQLVQRWTSGGKAYFFDHLTCKHGAMEESVGLTRGNTQAQRTEASVPKPLGQTGSLPPPPPPPPAPPPPASPPPAPPAQAPPAASMPGCTASQVPTCAATPSGEATAQLDNGAQEAEAQEGWSVVASRKSKKPPPQRKEESAGYSSAPQPSLAAADPYSGGDTLMCSRCRKKKHYNEFHKKQQKYSLTERFCIVCLEQESAEKRLIKCIVCEEKLDRDLFNKNVKWDAPTCRQCWERQEEKEYKDRCEEWERQREEQQRLREQMSEAQLRDYYEENIVGRLKARAISIPCSHEEVRLPYASEGAVKRIWGLMVGWSARLAELLNQEMEKGESSPLYEYRYWSEETPSREHASDKTAAKHFKELEDAGDKLVYKLGEEIFAEFVAKERRVELTQLMCRDAHPTPGGRSWQIGDEVLLSVRPVVQGWPDGLCVRHDLRAEPRTGSSLRPGRDDFAQYDQNAHHMFASARPVLPAETTLEVKMVPAALWADIEGHLYNRDGADGDGRGSHNQVFGSYCSSAGGAGQMANRTEVMNLFADLLGFYEDHEGKSQQRVGRQIWDTHFGHLFPQRLRVSYGGGKEFKADKEWAQKMEANMAEALIGALHLAGLTDHARAAVTLCVLCAVVRPAGVLPSNWDMAEKVLQVEEHFADTAEFVLRHLDVLALQRSMEELLRIAGHRP